mmetsp:Transcript_40638/g.73180  ORF Transcript_40638/g.73180 Transcript_40638/m.73180 type:complete len:403 (-) Transcript_40638:136-1344(-)
MLESIVVVALPSMLMLLGSAVAFFGRVPDMLQAALQNFSAGLLIAAVAGELFPLMTGSAKPAGSEARAETSMWPSTIAIALGFSLALAFMFGLEELTEEDESEGETGRKHSKSDLEQPLVEPADSKKLLQAVSTQAGRMEQTLATLQRELPRGDRDAIDEHVHTLKIPVHAIKRVLEDTPETLDEHNRDRMQFHSEELAGNLKDLKSSKSASEASKALKAVRGTLKHLHEHAERVKFKRWAALPFPVSTDNLTEIVPWPLVFTVVVDAGVDGLLIGLAFAASESAGWSMSIATTIEMCFLGLSFSATIQNATRSKLKHAGIVLLPPVVLYLIGIAGSLVGQVLEESPLVFTSFISFAVVALLFLVTQELLAEARETAGESKLIISMFFVGVFGGIVLEKIIG